MKRRSFIQLLGGGAVGALIAPEYLLKGRSMVTVPGYGIAGDFRVDYADKTIRYVGTGDKHTVSDLYKYLADLLDEPAQMENPAIATRTTKHHMTLENGYTIDDHTAKFINLGSITQTTPDGKEMYYSGIIQIGAVPPGEEALPLVRGVDSIKLEPKTRPFPRLVPYEEKTFPVYPNGVTYIPISYEDKPLKW